MCSAKNKSNSIDTLAQYLIELVQILRQGGPAIHREWWKKQSPSSIFNSPSPYQNGLSEFESVVQGVLKLNPDMLSEEEVKRRLVFQFLEPQISDMYRSEHLYEKSLVCEAQTQLSELIQFQYWQNVDIPIVNLQLEGEPVKLGYVTFSQITEHELAKWQSRETTWPPTDYDIQVVARVNAPSDLQKALFYARTEVNRTLNVLRALCFNSVRGSDILQIGMLGDYTCSTAIPIRINDRHFAAILSSTIGLRPPLLELKQHILSKLDEHKWELVNGIMQKTKPNMMESKLLNGIHWLGESTKPDINSAKFVKTCFALEAMIGGEPKKDEYLAVRGITAMLAERAAFIAGNNLEDRTKIAKDLNKYYGQRGKIVHKGKLNVPFSEIDGFRRFVRRLALALLEKLNQLGEKLSNVNELEAWIQSQRYTLPNDPVEGGN